jgi:hypothetical protein
MPQTIRVCYRDHTSTTPVLATFAFCSLYERGRLLWSIDFATNINGGIYLQ